MKKIFTATFLIFYMLSSLGAASVQHYCHVTHQSVSTNVEACCCEAQAESCPLQLATQNSCCVVAPPVDGVEHDDTVTATRKGCKTENSYDHIDTSPLPHSSNAGSDTIAQSFAILHTVTFEDVISDEKFTRTSDPSRRLNLPLLI